MSEPLPHMPPVQFAPVNGMRMAYYEVARPPEDRLADVVPIVLCHGFPELAYSWRHQLKALEAAGRWAVAPDQRGYGLTGGAGRGSPAEIDAYDADHLTSDLAGLLDHLGARQAVWCGHDWGSIIVWQMPLRQPDRTAGVIGMNVPYVPYLPTDPMERLRARAGEANYVVEFQTPETPDAVLDADIARTVSFFMRRDWGEEGIRRGYFGSLPREIHPLVRMLAEYDPAKDDRPSVLSEEDFAVWVRMFEATGFTGGINWYRNISRNWRTAQDLPIDITVPCLMLMAEFDPVLPPIVAKGMEAYCPDLEKVLIRRTGHWTQQEQPQIVGQTLIDWLERRFPKLAAA